MMKWNARTVKFLSSLLFCCLFITACSPQITDDKKSPAQSIEELRQQLEQVLKDTNLPGMSVAIVHQDGPEWIAGLGKADVAKDRDATAETLFRIGSVSKTFVSLSVLALVDQSKLKFEDTVRQLAPEIWFENAWESTDPIRIVNLLEHTTGWDDMHFREYAKNSSTITLLEAFDYDHHSRTSRWCPSTRMAYCNSGPPVAAYIVEKITGERFEDYVEQHFFRPIGMKTATYFQPTSNLTTTYHSDGQTPYTYADIIYRPSGSINASANDMANYLLFYLNRGKVNGIQIMPATAIARMEIPTSTWAAKEGLKCGYGLSNYWNVNDGFVYHGHNGGIDGGITEMAYMPDAGIGYFYSINSANGEAFNKIGTIIRAYITRNLQKPPLPSTTVLPPNATEYTGWYEPNSPRVELVYFLERLLGLAHIDFEDNKLLITSIGEKNSIYLPVTETQFRHVPKNDSPEPVATVELLKPNSEGRFIQLGLGMITMKKIPSWLAILEIISIGFVLLSVVSILVYAPFWIIGGLIRKRRRPAERGMRVWPLIAVISLVCFGVIPVACSEDFSLLLGTLNLWSFFLFSTTIVFAVASGASVVAIWRAPKQETRLTVRIYSTMVTAALMITTAYFAYWGIIGLRMWA